MVYAEASGVASTSLCGSKNVNTGSVASIPFSISKDFFALGFYLNGVFLVSSVKVLLLQCSYE